MKGYKGYIVLAASIVIQVGLGSVYAWSVFVPSLTSSFGLTQAQSQIIFGATIAVFTLSMVFAGRLQNRYGPAPVAFIGGTLFGTGYLTASFSGGSFVPLLLGVGFIAGAGIGFGYVCPIATCIKWFPKKKGLISGLAVAGFGGGAVLLSALAGRLFAEGKSVLEVFRFVGLWYGAAIVAASLFLSNPYKTTTRSTGESRIGRQVFSDRRFWRLVTGIWAGTFGGLLVIGNLQPIGLASNIPPALAAAAVGSFAVGNSLGRLGWGALIDGIGDRAIPASLLFLCSAIAMLLLPFPAPWMFVAVSMLAGFGFGACFVVYMTQTANDFGAENMASIYPLIFLAYGFSGIVGPTVGGWLYDVSGSYFPAILVGAGVVLFGVVAQHLL
ncbi:MAG: MFS transporter, partial [Chitinivibrionales bacterium]|nr:MFS transporter [Chitinivibrionales bacterium]